MNNCSTCKPPASHHPRPIRKAYVPVPPASPVVSVSRKSHFVGSSSAVRVLRESDSSRVRDSNSSAMHDGSVNSGVENQFRRSEEHTSELQSLTNLVCRLLLEKKK